MHLVRYYAAYANRCRAMYRDPGEETGAVVVTKEADRRPSRASWARLLRKVFEIELTCPRCGGALAIVSFITKPETVDRILAHVREEEVDLLFDARAPPAA